jgi:hypothetical protein
LNKVSFIKHINKTAKEFGYQIRKGKDLIQLSSPNGPLTLNIEISSESQVFIYLFLRFTSWDAPGERTDLNEFYTLLFCSFFRILGDASYTIWDIEHPACSVPETEVYARYILLTQPSASVYRISEPGYLQIKDLIAKIQFFNFIMPELLDWTVEYVDGKPFAEPAFSCNETTPWAANIARIIKEPLGDAVQYSSRVNPTWKHYRSIATSITVFEAPNPARKLKELIAREKRWEILNGPTGKLYISSAVKNFLPNKEYDKIQYILSNLQSSNDIAFIPLENMLVGVSDKYFACIISECGIKAFEIERERIRKRHVDEGRILFPARTFLWNDKIDDDRFELFVLDLLKREREVVWARKVSTSRERDGGRDIISEWKLPALDQIAVEEKPPTEVIKILVQAKASTRPLSKSRVTDIRDTVEHFEAHGYLLVTSNYLTTTFTNHLERERDRKKIHIDWWTRSEIEDRLRYDSNADLVQEYSDIIVTEMK